ncbi:hypothetical protein MITS9509_01747 [Synechococcus sp. MIT S9509]|nr:hypothetical protein MITS9509_01747 [Synechococcus sp. MIT S9509]
MVYLSAAVYANRVQKFLLFLMEHAMNRKRPTINEKLISAVLPISRMCSFSIIYSDWSHAFRSGRLGQV